MCIYDCVILFLQVSDICVGEYPQTVDVYLYNELDRLVNSTKQVELFSQDTNTIIATNVLKLSEDNRYTAVVSLSNLDGEFGYNSSINFSKLKCLKYNCYYYCLLTSLVH